MRKTSWRLALPLLLLLLALAGCGGARGSDSGSGGSGGGTAPGPAAGGSGLGKRGGSPAPAAAPPAAAQDTGFGFAYGTYGLRVPGAAYETPIAGTDQSKLTVSTGTRTASTLTLNPDGTYIWNSAWDGKVIKGSWQKTGKSDYPILLAHGQEGKDWHLAKGDGAGKGEILLWDGNYMSYVGDRAR